MISCVLFVSLDCDVAHHLDFSTPGKPQNKHPLYLQLSEDLLLVFLHFHIQAEK